jgi:hypothetical protein
MAVQGEASTRSLMLSRNEKRGPRRVIRVALACPRRSLHVRCRLIATELTRNSNSVAAFVGPQTAPHEGELAFYTLPELTAGFIAHPATILFLSRSF